MPRSKSFYSRMAEAGEGVFFPSETKVQNSAKYKSYDCELQATLTDLRVKYRDFIRKTHAEVLELKQFLNDVQKTRPAAVDLKRIEKRHRQRRLMEQTETEFIKVRVDNELVTLPILVRKKTEKAVVEKKHSRKGERKRHHKRRTLGDSDEGEHHDKKILKNVGLERAQSMFTALTSEDTIVEEQLPIKTHNEDGSQLPNLVDYSETLTTTDPHVLGDKSNSKTSKERRVQEQYLPIPDDIKLKRHASLPELVVIGEGDKRVRKTEKA